MNYTCKLTNSFASQLLLIALISLFTSLLTNCSSTAAADKKSKHNSSKAKKSHDALDEEESDNKEESSSKEAQHDDHANKHMTAKDGHGEDEKQAHNDKNGAEKDSKKHDHHSKEKHEHHSKETIDKDEIWDGLIKGNKRFVIGKPQTRQLAAARHELASGQHPKVIVLGCADSHVSPELVFDKNLGELFVVRTAGNIADPLVLGSMEYSTLR